MLARIVAGYRTTSQQSGIVPWCWSAFSAQLRRSELVALTVEDLHRRPDGRIKSDTEAYSATLLRGQGGWLSPNDCRPETGWPAVPGGDDISPPNTSAAAVASDSPPADGGKVLELSEHRPVEVNRR
jgi:hypothetical protein